MNRLNVARLKENQAKSLKEVDLLKYWIIINNDMFFEDEVEAKQIENLKNVIRFRVVWTSYRGMN